MKHKHSYLRAAEIEKPSVKGVTVGGSTYGFRTIQGNVHVCVLFEWGNICGRTLHVWADGTVDVAKEGSDQVK